MKKEDLVKLGLDDETATKVAEASADELKSFIPKTRFDDINEAKKKLEEDIKSRDTQLEALKKVDAEGLKAEIEKLQNENKTAKEKYESELKQVQINSAVDKALIEAKAKNMKAVKALLDLEKAEIDGEGIKGLSDQLKKLQESEDSKFLFDVKTDSSGKFKGVTPGEGKDKGAGSEAPISLADAVTKHFQKE